MTFLKWLIATIVGAAYGVVTIVALFDWDRISFASHLSTSQLAMHAALSGGAISAAMAFYCAAKRTIAMVLASAALWSAELAIGYFLIISGFGYWFTFKLFLALGCVMVIRTQDRVAVKK